MDQHNKNINLQKMFETWKTDSNACFGSGWCNSSLGLHQKITSDDRECHLGHFLTSNSFISMTKHGLPITSWQGRAIKTALEGNIIFTITNVALWYDEFHSTLKELLTRKWLPSLFNFMFHVQDNNFTACDTPSDFLRLLSS
jgi:hypothetical protein